MLSSGLIYLPSPESGSTCAVDGTTLCISAVGGTERKMTINNIYSRRQIKDPVPYFVELW